MSRSTAVFSVEFPTPCWQEELSEDPDAKRAAGVAGHEPAALMVQDDAGTGLWFSLVVLPGWPQAVTVSKAQDKIQKLHL